MYRKITSNVLTKTYRPLKSDKEAGSQHVDRTTIQT